MPLVVGEALSVVWQEPPVSNECPASCGTRSSALDHLPESVAGAAVLKKLCCHSWWVRHGVSCGRSPRSP